jgi:hypothetical protein
MVTKADVDEREFWAEVEALLTEEFEDLAAADEDPTDGEDWGFDDEDLE